MSLPLLAIAVLCVLFAGYRWYSRIVARNFRLDDAVKTPANVVNDGVDYVPTGPFYLLGQHFSAIAAAGPIAGPILACQQFGWLPCLIWIGLGVVFIGAVHDFASLVASIRHGGQSVAEVMAEHVGKRAWLAMMAFIWLALNYVIVAFADLTASTFVGITEEFQGGTFRFNPGGAVAAASILYLLLAVVMGVIQKRWNPKLWILTAIFVPATLFVVWLGTRVSTSYVLPFENPQKVWGLLILAYCFVASLLPVWSLLQPRGYLGGFVLYIALAVGVIGVFLGGLRYPGEFDIRQPWFRGFHAPGPTGLLFPFLFVTIACGACSGFHGLVCSGTTSKQIDRESYTRPVGYGAMLLEAFVALIAMATIMTVAQGEKMPGPGKIYGDGIGRFLTVIIGKQNLIFAMTFGAMAFSTFVFDTLDVSTRLGRYILQELMRWKGKAAMLSATALTLALPMLFLWGAPPTGPGRRPAYMDFWTLFGTSNQLLAALTLLGITIWLHRTGRRTRYTLIPMVVVFVVTLTALTLQVRQSFVAIAGAGFSLQPATVNGVVGLLLILLALMLLFEGAKAARGKGTATPGGLRGPAPGSAAARRR